MDDHYRLFSPTDRAGEREGIQAWRGRALAIAGQYERMRAIETRGAPPASRAGSEVNCEARSGEDAAAKRGEQADPGDRMRTLTPTELKVCGLLAERLSTRDIADRLFTSPRTIETHRGSIRRKLGLGREEDLADHLRGFGRRGA